MSRSKSDDTPSLLSRALTRDADFKKDDFLNVIHWLRQIISLIFGLVAGIYGLTGLTTILIYFAISFGFVHFYAYRFIGYEDESTESHEIYTEALMLSFMVFVLTWVLTYTFI